MSACRQPKKSQTGLPLVTSRVPRARRSRTGFTVMEILVVVLIVTLLAAMAIPGIAKRARGNRARGLLEQAAVAYRTGRLNALGRGAATLVRFDQATGSVTVHEAIQGAAAAQGVNCASLPSNTCTPIERWMTTSTTNQLLSTTNLTDFGGFTPTMSYRDATGTEITAPVVEICFTPGGRTFVRSGASADATGGVTFATMVGSAKIEIVDPDGGIRYAAIPPNGAARTVRTQ